MQEEPTPASEEPPPVHEDEAVLRRCPPIEPEFIVVHDLITGDIRLASGALQVDEDGISVWRSELLRSRGFDAKTVREKSDQYIFEFSVRAVYDSGWLVKPDIDRDVEYGFAHALIQVPGMTPETKISKAAKKGLRARIAGEAYPVVFPTG